MFLKLCNFTVPRSSQGILPAVVTGKYSFPTHSLTKTSLFLRSQHTLPQDVLEDTTEADKLASRALIEKVNHHIATGPGRLFAVIQINAKQYKIVENDLILIERHWPPDVGDELTFEKVLLVGGSSFTLIGKPILPRNLVTVTGTIINKDLTHTKLRYFHVRKKRVHNLNFIREELTYLRIKKVQVHPELNDPNKTEFLRA